nr:MAG TPA: hypothetical protein [Caudoviricetes sp.]
MPPLRCQQCSYLRHCINGCFCVKLRRYIEHAPNPLCTASK